jgi:hypothetical protein
MFLFKFVTSKFSLYVQSVAPPSASFFHQEVLSLCRSQPLTFPLRVPTAMPIITILNLCHPHSQTFFVVHLPKALANLRLCCVRLLVLLLEAA